MPRASAGVPDHVVTSRHPADRGLAAGAEISFEEYQSSELIASELEFQQRLTRLTCPMFRLWEGHPDEGSGRRTLLVLKVFRALPAILGWRRKPVTHHQRLVEHDTTDCSLLSS